MKNEKEKRKKKKEKKKKEKKKTKRKKKRQKKKETKVRKASVPKPVTPGTGYLAPAPTCIDGWVGDGWVMGDGWMDGLVTTCFLSVYFSKTTQYMTLIVFMPTRRHFKTPFVKKSKFLNNLFFVKKFRTKRGYFEIFFKKNS